MKTKILFISVLFLFIIISCQKNDNEEPITVVNGLVVDSLNNNPLKGVTIQLYKDELFSEFPVPVTNYKTSTDSLGKFIMQFKRDNNFVSYFIELKKTGYSIKNPNYNSLIHIDLDRTQNIIIKMGKI